MFLGQSFVDIICISFFLVFMKAEMQKVRKTLCIKERGLGLVWPKTDQKKDKDKPKILGLCMKPTTKTKLVLYSWF